MIAYHVSDEEVSTCYKIIEIVVTCDEVKISIHMIGL